MHLGLIHTLITTKNYYDYHHYCYYCYYTLFIISYHLLFQNHLMDMKRSKVQCKIFVEEYISASFLLWCSMWLQLFLSHQQLHVYIQIQTVACLYTNTNDEIIERFECKHDLSQVFISLFRRECFRNICQPKVILEKFNYFILQRQGLTHY